jgi:cytochrome P450
MTATQQAPTDSYLSEEFISDPVAAIDRMRDEDPVHLIPGINAWMVTRWKDVRELFTHASATNDRRVYENYHSPPDGSAARSFADNSLFAVEPERHARMRSLVSDPGAPCQRRTL